MAPALDSLVEGDPPVDDLYCYDSMVADGRILSMTMKAWQIQPQGRWWLVDSVGALVNGCIRALTCSCSGRDDREQQDPRRTSEDHYVQHSPGGRASLETAVGFTMSSPAAWCHCGHHGDVGELRLRGAHWTGRAMVLMHLYR